MKKNNNHLIGLTVLAVVVLHILAKSSLFDPFWSRILATAAPLVAVGGIAYVALRRGANVSILSGSQRELASRSQQVASVNLLGGHQALPRPRRRGDDGRRQLRQHSGRQRPLPAGRLAG